MQLPVEQNVELKVPVDASYVSVVRLLVSGLGTRIGLAVDEIENLKLVAGEAFLTIVDKCEQTLGLITLRWRQAEEHIAISLVDPSGKHRERTLANSAEPGVTETPGWGVQFHDR